MSEDALQALVDRAAISDVVVRYATGLDRRDWSAFRSVFTDEIEMDFESVGIPAGRVSADAWVADARALFAGFDATQHQSSNHVFDLRGDEAICISSMQAEHFVGEERWTIGGYYTNELVRTAGGWKIHGLILTVTWQRGNREVPRLARRRSRGRSAEDRA
ncbi:MAG: nuclear transport factor 2 family protein [Myxococcota bacterium]